MKFLRRKMITATLATCLLTVGGLASAADVNPILPGQCSNMLPLAEILANHNDTPVSVWNYFIDALIGPACNK